MYEEPLASWRAAFAAFEDLLADGPILIALDEFQFVARRNAEIGSLLNDLIERHKEDANLRLILAGSDVSFFERDVVGYGAISYGRRTGSLRLEPFQWSSIEPFVPGWSVEDRIRVWAVYGGMPYYLDGMRLVRRRYPVTRQGGTKVFYAITDPFLRFWFQFVAPYESRLQSRESARRHLHETVLPALEEFVSRDAFEEVCHRWALQHIPEAVEVGRWWGSKRVRTADGLRTRRYEADMAAIDAGGRIVALGSCKWSTSVHRPPSWTSSRPCHRCSTSISRRCISLTGPASPSDCTRSLSNAPACT